MTLSVSGERRLKGARWWEMEKVPRGLTEDPPQVKEPGPADAQRLLDLFPAHETLLVGLEQKGDLLVRKALVKLAHDSLRSGC